MIVTESFDMLALESSNALHAPLCQGNAGVIESFPLQLKSQSAHNSSTNVFLVDMLHQGQFQTWSHFGFCRGNNISAWWSNLCVLGCTGSYKRYCVLSGNDRHIHFLVWMVKISQDLRNICRIISQTYSRSWKILKHSQSKRIYTSELTFDLGLCLPHINTCIVKTPERIRCGVLRIIVE